MAEAKDTLKSKATLTILDLLGEGPIGGLVNGNQSAFFNDTQLQNADGTYNFQGVTTSAVNGNNTQFIGGNYGNFVETPYNIGSQIKVNTPYTFSIVNPMADAVRVIVNFPSLTTTDTGTGDITGATVQYKFQMSINGGAFNDVPATQQWQAGGSWTDPTGSPLATSVAGATSVRASIKAVVNTAYRTFGAITVQPQEFNGSAWVNLGGQREITVTAAQAGYNNYGGIQYSMWSDVVTVESRFSQVRFVQIKATPWVSLQTGDIMSNMSSPLITVSGKSRSKYQRKHIISIPRPANSVEIRMVRVSPDATSAYVANETYLDSYYEIITLNMAYPNSALFGFTVDSEQFNQIPSRSYLVDGLYINVPSNYDPVSRTYTGVWNGSFKSAVSNNPAWVMYDILTNSRYGLGTYLGGAQVDKAMLYTIGRYCDEMVPDGFGGMEPRFTLNTVINSRQDAYKVISDIASAFRGMSYWAGGLACFTQDAPTDPTMIYGRANVIDGQFTYTGSARKDRHSVVHVTWNDPNENYKKKIEYVEDPELVQLYGIRKLDTLAFGCATRGQAARVGKWILYTEKYESDFITFKVGLDSAFVQPGNVIKIQDPARAGRRVAGRLRSCDSNEAHLDAETQIDVQGTISLMMPDGTFVDRVLHQSDGAYQVVTWDDPLPALPEANAVWLIQEEELVPLLARVVSISQTDATTFEITAVEHNPSKYAAIETGLHLEERRTSIIDPSFAHVPTQFNVTEALYLSAPGVIATKLLVSWFGDSTNYELTYQGTSNSNYSNPIKVAVSGLSYEIPNAQLGNYDLKLVAINPLGRRSAAVSTSHTTVGKMAPPSNVPTFTSSGTDQGIKLEWTGVTDLDLKAYEIRQCHYLKENWETAAYVAQVSGVSKSYTLPPLPTGAYMWLIKAVDQVGLYSADATWTQLNIGNPAAPTISATFTQGDVKLTWVNAKTTFPLEIYEVRVGPTFDSASTVARTSSETVSLPATWSGDQTFWVAAIDVAGNTGEPASLVVSVEPPAVSNLQVQIVADSYRLTWDAAQGSLPVSQFEIRMGSVSDTWYSAVSIADLSSNIYESKVAWVGAKKFFVAAIDSGGNAGPSSSVTLNIAAPAAPSMTSAVSGTNLTLTWPTPALGSLALDEYELRMGSGAFSSATLLSQLKGNTITVPITWVGDQTFQIVAKDVAGNASSVGTKVVTVNAPAAPLVSGSFLADMFNLGWNAPSATLPIAEYEIRYGTPSSSWASSQSTAIRVKATVFSLSAQWLDTRRWWVAGIDANGNMGAPGQIDVTITAPSAPAVTRKVIDNNVLLYWSDSTGTLPVATYELRRGDIYASASVIGKKSGGFTTVFETAAGTYTYWLTAIDTAGNYGAPNSLVVTVDQPPDYILQANDDLDLSAGTRFHMALDTDGSYAMPVNVTETFQEHFSTRSWLSPSEQVSAGYEVYIEPTQSPGYYEDIIDYGAVLPSTKITATINGSVVAGAPVRSVEISLRKTTSDPWIVYNSDIVYAGDFRYLKIRFTVTGGGTDLYRLAGINVKLDTKSRADAGMGTSGATDAVTGTSAVINGVTTANANPANSHGTSVPNGDGTLVRFNTEFIDVSSLGVTVAAGGTAMYGIYDYVDAPYPAGFKVQLFDKNGNRVAGKFSWTANGV